MGYWLRRRLTTKSAVDANGTWRYKLPTIGLYSAFSIQLQAQRYANRTTLATQEKLYEAITKVELLSEGTKVIKSLRAAEIKVLNLYDFGRITPMQHREGANGYNIDTLYLLAGRSLKDKEYMFDMARLKDPEIAITNALTETTANLWKVDTLEYEIYGWRWMGTPVPTPRGYFRADERTYYTTTADGAEKLVAITPGKKLRRIMVKGWTERVSIASHFSDLELQVNEGEYSPIIIDSPMEWALQNKLEYGLDCKQVIAVYMYEIGNTHMVDVELPYHSSALAVMAELYAGQNLGATVGNGVLDVIMLMDADSTFAAQEVECWVDGAGFGRALILGFDKEPDLSDMLDTAGMGKIQLILTEGAASRVISVVVEELVTY